MKKISIAGLLLSFILSLTSVISHDQIQSRVKVTVRIDRLRALSKDACNGKMDFKGKITIYQDKKSFPVLEGNDIRPGWELTTTLIQKKINIKIDIWDDDDALCGGGDDAVIVTRNGSQTLAFSLNPADIGTKTTTITGKKVSGKEQAEITFTTTIVAL